MFTYHEPRSATRCSSESQVHLTTKTVNFEGFIHSTYNEYKTSTHTSRQRYVQSRAQFLARIQTVHVFS